jgi:hypothetical protein
LPFTPRGPSLRWDDDQGAAAGIEVTATIGKSTRTAIDLDCGE